mmetsp:Transcript_24420/g.92230  ORF Transcript_24420/g.92230 Transcript_24420/m.92230 type:complete len:253 (-) Transcript_24420:83-841(-)
MAPRRGGGDAGIGINATQRLGNVTREPGEHRPHAQLHHRVENRLLQLRLALDPVLVQGAPPCHDVAHALPRQECRSGKPLAHLRVGHPDLEPKLLPDQLLAGERQRKVHTVERKPVELALPPGPVPKGGRVAKRAHVPAVRVLERAHHSNGSWRGQGRDGVESHASPVHAPGNGRVQVVGHVLVDTRADGNARVAANHNPGARAVVVELVSVVPALWVCRDDLQLELRRDLLAKHARGDAPGARRGIAGSCR